jgi:hypothetical protein
MGVMSAGALQRLVEFMYCGELEVGGDVGLEELLGGAELLELPLASSAIEAFLRERLSVRTWAEARRLGERFAIPALSTAATDWAAANFGAAGAAAAAWRAVPGLWVAELLQREDLAGCSSEDTVLSAALSWAEGRAEGGAEAGDGTQLSSLLELVRLPHVSSSSAVRLSQSPMVRSCVASMHVLLDLGAYTADPDRVDAAGLRQRWAPRPCFAGAQSLVAITSGVHAGAVSAFRYHAASSRWTSLPAPPAPLRGAAAAALDGVVYFAGGMHSNVHDGQPAAHVFRFDPAAADGEGAWAAVAPMLHPRVLAAAAAFNGHLYVAGGEGPDRSVFSSVERYSPATNSWELVADMEESRKGLQLLALGGSLYAIGGRDADDDHSDFDDDDDHHHEWPHVLATVERYDPAANVWHDVESMAVARFEPSAVVMNGTIVVAGGYDDDDSALSSCERYDPVTCSWSSIAALPESREPCVLAFMRGSLCVVGGHRASVGFNFGAPMEPLPTLRLDPRADSADGEWVELPLDEDSPVKDADIIARCAL